MLPIPKTPSCGIRTFVLLSSLTTQRFTVCRSGVGPAYSIFIHREPLGHRVSPDLHFTGLREGSHACCVLAYPLVCASHRAARSTATGRPPAPAEQSPKRPRR